MWPKVSWACAVLVLRFSNHNILRRSQLVQACEQSPKQLTLKKDTEGQWQLLNVWIKKSSLYREKNAITHPLSQIPGYATVLIIMFFFFYRVLLSLYSCLWHVSGIALSMLFSNEYFGAGPVWPRTQWRHRCPSTVTVSWRHCCPVISLIDEQIDKQTNTCQQNLAAVSVGRRNYCKWKLTSATLRIIR